MKRLLLIAMICIAQISVSQEKTIEVEVTTKEVLKPTSFEIKITLSEEQRRVDGKYEVRRPLEELKSELLSQLTKLAIEKENLKIKNLSTNVISGYSYSSNPELKNITYTYVTSDIKKAQSILENTAIKDGKIGISNTAIYEYDNEKLKDKLFKDIFKLGLIRAKNITKYSKNKIGKLIKIVQGNLQLPSKKANSRRYTSNYRINKNLNLDDTFTASFTVELTYILE